jgi:hypothetical protein
VKSKIKGTRFYPEMARRILVIFREHLQIRGEGLCKRRFMEAIMKDKSCIKFDNSKECRICILRLSFAITIYKICVNYSSLIWQLFAEHSIFILERIYSVNSKLGFPWRYAYLTKKSLIWRFITRNSEVASIAIDCHRFLEAWYSPMRGLEDLRAARQIDLIESFQASLRKRFHSSPAD